MDRPLTLAILDYRLSVCRLSPDAPLPAWAQEAAFFAITRTPEELSLVCPQECVPAGVQREGPWRAFKVLGPLDFSLIGILAGLSSVLAQARISLFALSTYDTDYILVREPDFTAACQALITAGYSIQ